MKSKLGPEPTRRDDEGLYDFKRRLSYWRRQKAREVLKQDSHLPRNVIQAILTLTSERHYYS